MRQLSIPKLVLPFLLVAAALGTVLYSVDTTYAANTSSQDITMTPSSTDLSIAPGETVVRSFKIINGGSDAYDMNASVAPYHVEGENYDPKFTSLPGVVTPTAWVTITSSHTTVQPGETVTVEYTVTVPQKTAPGGYYAVLFAETSPRATAGNSGVVPHNRVGNLLFITVKGPVKTSGKLTAAPLSYFAITDKVPIGVRASNTGGVHFISTTNMTIKAVTGKQLHASTLERYILPQTERLVTTDWKPSMPVGLYTVSRSATIAGKTQSLPDQTILVVQPWFFSLIVALIVLTALYLVMRRRTWRPKRNARK